MDSYILLKSREEVEFTHLPLEYKMFITEPGIMAFSKVLNDYTLEYPLLYKENRRIKLKELYNND